MTNEEFQKAVLSKLEDNDRVQKVLLEKFDTLENGQNELKEEIKNIKTRQDEIYQVVRAIEHSNQIGRSELDSQNIRIAKLEGKFQKVAKAYNEEVEIDKASNI